MEENDYSYIKDQIDVLRNAIPFLRDKSDSYVFSALCIKSDYYKNPNYVFGEKEIREMMVDGSNDGGVDAIFLDPNSDEAKNLVLVQSKFYEKKVSAEEIRSALHKMNDFYQNVNSGNYGTIRPDVQSRFLQMNAEIGDESKIQFVFYTSAPKKSIDSKKLIDNFSKNLKDSRIEIKILFQNDVKDEIIDSLSRKPFVESGKIFIDKANNYLEYGDEDEGQHAIIVSASAYQIKKLYATYQLALLSRNLRYHVKDKKSIDDAIQNTIDNSPDTFWFKNNGITIICDDFVLSGKEVKLSNFSIINGGQTTYNLHKCGELTEANDFYLPCKIIKAQGDTENDKNQFSLDIATATNSQKPIKQIDLKANTPEQIYFEREMINIGVFYKTKRGLDTPKRYSADYLHTDLGEVGKLMLAGIFELPASSRSKPSILYRDEFYGPVFKNGNRSQMASLAKEFLYVDFYFRNSFLSKYEKEVAEDPNKDELLEFARNSRTLCVAFVGLVARFKQGIITSEDLQFVFKHINDDYKDYLYDIFRKTGNMKSLFGQKTFENKESMDSILYGLFEVIISCGRIQYHNAKMIGSVTNVSNFLKKDANYYNLLCSYWSFMAKDCMSVLKDLINEYVSPLQ